MLPIFTSELKICRPRFLHDYVTVVGKGASSISSIQFVSKLQTTLWCYGHIILYATGTNKNFLRHHVVRRLKKGPRGFLTQ